MTEEFFQSLTAAWQFLLLISNGPLGAYTALAVLVASGAAMPLLRRWLVHAPCADARDLVAEAGSLAVGVGVGYALMPSIYGVMVGFVLGLASPFFWRMCTAVGGLWLGYVRRRLGVPNAD